MGDTGVISIFWGEIYLCLGLFQHGRFKNHNSLSHSILSLFTFAVCQHWNVMRRPDSNPSHSRFTTTNILLLNHRRSTNSVRFISLSWKITFRSAINCCELRVAAPWIYSADLPRSVANLAIKIKYFNFKFRKVQLWIFKNYYWLFY